MKRKAVMILITVGFLVQGLATIALSREVPRLNKEQVRDMLDDPQVHIIDVRLGPDWYGSDSKILGAVWQDPGKVNQWGPLLDRDVTYVIYCA
jgi:hypothetical protein